MGMDFELLVRIFPEVLLDGIILGFMYALIALGYTMVYAVLELTETMDVSVKSLVVIVSALLMLWALHLIVNRTKVGTAIRAVAEDQAAASLMGIDVNRIISLTFLIGGAMGGAAGVLFGVQYG